jgi:hypothetical protein
VIEMPRSRSISIQSDTACALRLAAAHGAGQLDGPGIEQGFSVSVVLPASGCEMMANVRRSTARLHGLVWACLVDDASRTHLARR